MSKKTIPRKRSLVNIISESVLIGRKKLGVIKAKANQAAEILPVTADNAFRKARFVLVTKIF